MVRDIFRNIKNDSKKQQFGSTVKKFRELKKRTLGLCLCMRECTNHDYNSAAFIWGGNLKLMGGSTALTVDRGVMLLSFAMLHSLQKGWF